MADSEIQLNLLADKKQDKGLEEIVQFIERKEAGKRSAGKLLQTQGAAATHSQYRRDKQNDTENTPSDQQPPHDQNKCCSYCGKHGQGTNAPPKLRRNVCPAYGHTCEHCGRQNHYQKVFRSKDNLNHSSPSQQQSTQMIAIPWDSHPPLSNLRQLPSPLWQTLDVKVVWLA